jgi:hypothetical protein
MTPMDAIESADGNYRMAEGGKVLCLMVYDHVWKAAKLRGFGFIRGHFRVCRIIVSQPVIPVWLFQLFATRIFRLPAFIF